MDNLFNDTSFLDQLRKLSVISSNVEDSPTIMSPQTTASDIDEAFDLALEECASNLEVTVDYYIEEFLM